MNLPLFRQIFKELRILSKKQPRIALHISSLIHSHVLVYKQSLPRMQKKLKKQQDHQLVQAFVNFLKIGNYQTHDIHGYRIKKIMVEIFTGINVNMDEKGFLRKGLSCKQIGLLNQYEQYVRLKTQQEKEWVKRVILNLFKGQQKYQFPNLTTFFNEAKRSDNNIVRDIQDIVLQKRQYIQRILQGQITDVSKQYVQIYNELFKKDNRQNYTKIMQSYIKSNYILVDLDLVYVQTMKTKR